MVTRWEMSSRLGSVFLGREVGLRERQSHSERTSALVDEEMQQLIGERSPSVRQLLPQHQGKLDRLAQVLLEQESLDEQQIRHLVTPAESLSGVGESKTSSGALVVSAGKS
jgi:cell division protease FtsH